MARRTAPTPRVHRTIRVMQKSLAMFAPRQEMDLSATPHGIVPSAAHLLWRSSMTHRARRSPSILACITIALSFWPAVSARAQERPRSGGELIFVVAAEPPSFDGHREETFAMLHPG